MRRTADKQVASVKCNQSTLALTIKCVSEKQEQAYKQQSGAARNCLREASLRLGALHSSILAVSSKDVHGLRQAQNSPKSPDRGVPPFQDHAAIQIACDEHLHHR